MGYDLIGMPVSDKWYWNLLATAAMIVMLLFLLWVIWALH